MQARHILPLTGIRAVAASWVVLYHFHPFLVMLCPALVVLDCFVKIGYEAVPLFFLLSGFILSHNYFPGYLIAQHPRFVFYRFARLWPVHFVVFIFLVLDTGFPGNIVNQVKSSLNDLLMIGAWFGQGSRNPPAWSISAEWFAYICVFPLAFLAYRRIRQWPWLVAIVALLLGVHTSPVNGWLFPAPTRWGSIFFLFLAGSGLYQLRCLLKNPPVWVLMTTGVALFLAYGIFNQYLSALVLYLSFALLILGLSYERGLLARILSTKLMVQGGLASYSLYMTHFLIIQAFIFYTWSSWKEMPHLPLVARYGILLLAAGALTGTALLFYRCIEEPMNRKLRRLFEKGSICTTSKKVLLLKPSTQH